MVKWHLANLDVVLKSAIAYKMTHSRYFLFINAIGLLTATHSHFADFEMIKPQQRFFLVRVLAIRYEERFRWTLVVLNYLKGRFEKKQISNK